MVVSAVPVGAIFGAAVAGQAADRLGRRYVIIAAAVVFIVGALISAAAPGLAVLLLARVLLGVAVGLASANAPVYISEVAPPESRGRLVSYFQLAVTVGILVAYLVGLAFSHAGAWRWMLGLGAVPALGARHRNAADAAEPALAGHGGRRTTRRAGCSRGSAGTTRRRSPRSWRRSRGASRRSPAAGATCCSRRSRRRCSSGSAWPSSSRSPASTRSSTTRRRSSSSPASTATPRRFWRHSASGIVNIGMTLVALRLIDRAGRRPLLMIGVTGMVISLIVLGAAFLGNAGTTLISAIAIISLMTYVASFAISLGPVFWLMNSEIYPLRVRSKAAGVGTMANWTSNFVISLTFLPLINLLGRTGRVLDLRGGRRSSRSGSAGSWCRRPRTASWRRSRRSSGSGPASCRCSSPRARR